MRRLVVAAARLAIAPIAFAALAAAAFAARPEAVRRRRSGQLPRLVYGPVPLINSKYLSRAMRARGYEAATFVWDVYPIHSRDDFDHVFRDFFGPLEAKSWPQRALLRLVGDFAIFAWLLPRFDVFHFYFDGGFLARTPLRFWEVQLLHLAGKRVVAMPYGSDVGIPSQIRSLGWRQGLMTHYPALGRGERETRRRIDYFCERADFVVACLVHMETLPRWDLLTTLYYPIDTDEWAPSGAYSSADGREGPVTVVHAPNHRVLKGTDQLLQAVRELQEEGCQVRLRLLERVPNTEVQRAMAEADIVADQFILGYALTALEGMSLGRPVLSNLSEPGYYEAARLHTGLDECPIVSTAPHQIKAHLRELIGDPERRRALGEAGRRYVLRHHSYQAMGRMWEAVYRQVWFGEKLGVSAWHAGREGATDPAPGTAA